MESRERGRTVLPDQTIKNLFVLFLFRQHRSSINFEETEREQRETKNDETECKKSDNE